MGKNVRSSDFGGILGATVPSSATLTILDARDRIVLRKIWHEDVVLPGASRDFIVPVRMQIPAGGYSAVTTMAFV